MKLVSCFRSYLLPRLKGAVLCALVANYLAMYAVHFIAHRRYKFFCQKFVSMWILSYLYAYELNSITSKFKSYHTVAHILLKIYKWKWVCRVWKDTDQKFLCSANPVLSYFSISEYLAIRLKKRKIFHLSKIANRYQYARTKNLVIFRLLYFGLYE